MAVQLSYEWQINYVLFIIPLILLVFCIMLLRKHDLISS